MGFERQTDRQTDQKQIYRQIDKWATYIEDTSDLIDNRQKDRHVSAQITVMSSVDNQNPVQLGVQIDRWNDRQIDIDNQNVVQHNSS